MNKRIALILLATFLAPALYAGDANVRDVRVHKVDTTHFDFEVIVSHPDTGMDHFADKIEIRGKDGKIYSSQPIIKPHVDDQPFRTIIEKVQIPADVKEVIVRASARPHGVGGETFTAKLP